MYSFNFLGKDSYLDFGIMITKRPSIFKPQRNIDYIEVPGRSGSLKIDYETYKDIVIPIECWFTDDIKNNMYIPDLADNINNWLNSGEGDLIFSNQPDKKYIAHVSDQTDIKQELIVLGEFLINFRCRPFKYAADNPLITLNAPGTIFNPGTLNSSPIIKIYGNGAIDLNINSNVIHLTNIVDYVTIDSELIDCYKDTQLMNNYMNGEFPELIPGSNSINWTGTVTKIEITPNWRWS